MKKMMKGAAFGRAEKGTRFAIHSAMRDALAVAAREAKTTARSVSFVMVPN